MLGEIIKSTEALRYHAKTAEIAGQNLAHVNDESYARQRVLSRDGLMSKGQGGLNVGSLQAGGLEHARNELLDKRVFAEFSESANLETQKEILSLLQAALGESIDRQSVSGGLDNDYESNLAAGGLARALDDLFNAFQELSASPDEATAKEEIVNKIKTLTKRFNDAGSAIDEIDADISSSVEKSVSSVNRLLEQIYEVNLQIKRFELLGQGQAVTYRDNRQKLLEDLSKLINFKIEPEVDADSLKETGFWNITTLDHQNQVVDLVSSTLGVAPLSKDFGKLITLDNPVGANAQVQAKISSDGSLGHIEVLDGGSQYNDTDGPILFAITPPTANTLDENDSGLAANSHQQGEVFSQGGKLYQALSDSLAGVELADQNQFLEITNIPANGAVFPESLRKFSDLENFVKGDQIYYEGKLYQATDSVGPLAELMVNDLNQLSNKLFKGEVVQYNDQFYQVLENLESGSEVNTLRLPELAIGEELDGLLSLGAEPPKVISDLAFVPSAVDTSRPNRWFLTKSYQAGDVVKFEDKFLEFTQDVFRGSELDELSRAMQALSYDQTKSYSEGDFIELGGNYYKFTGDVSAFADEETVANNLSEIIGGEDLPFDGSVKVIEDPNWNFLNENGSFKISEAFREFQLTGLSGSEQPKQIKVSGLDGDLTDVFNFDVFLNGEKVVFDDNLTEGDPSFSISGFSAGDFSESLKSKLMETEVAGQAISGTSATEPAFDVLVDATTGDLLVTGVPGLGDFQLVATPQNNIPEQADDVTAAITVIEERAYVADKYNLVFSSETFDPVNISVSFEGNAQKTAQAIADAITKDEVLSQSITAIVSGGDLTFRAKEQDFDFSVELAVEDLHDILNNSIKIDSKNVDPPQAQLIQSSNVGEPAVVSFQPVSSEDIAQSFEVTIPAGQSAELFEFVVTIENKDINFTIPAEINRTDEQLLDAISDKILEVELNGDHVDGVLADSPAFITSKENGVLSVSGLSGISPFSVSSQNLEVEDSSPESKIFLTGPNNESIGEVLVKWQGSQGLTAARIVQEIEADAGLSQLVDVEIVNESVIFTGKDASSDFQSISWNENNDFQFGGTLDVERILPANQIDQISNLNGLEQAKSEILSFLPAQLDENASSFEVVVNNQIIPLELPASVDPLGTGRFESLLNSFQSINQDGTITEDGSLSTNPAFSVTFDEVNFSYLIEGTPNTGDFTIEADANPGIESTTVQEYLSDDFLVSINDDTGNGPWDIRVSSFTDPKKNAEAIIDAINAIPEISQRVVASLSDDEQGVILESVDSTVSFTTTVSVDDKLNPFTVTQIEDLDASQTANLQTSGAQIRRIEKSGLNSIGLVTDTAQLIDFKKQEDPMIFQQNDLFYFNGDGGEVIHFIVTAPTGEVDPTEFDPLDAKWEDNFRVFKPKLVSEDDPSVIFRKAFPVGHNLDNGSLVELNIGLAEAVVKKGEITGFNILNKGNGLPSTDAVFVNGQELLIDSGSIKGYQDARSTHLETFRMELNNLVSSFVEEINSIYNPDDQPGGFVFGFDAILTRPVSGHNLLMEEEYGYYGREGDASITLYRDEVDMTLPSAVSEDFTIVNTTPIFPEEFSGNTLFYRGGDLAETTFRADDAGDLISFYASASKMQNVTMENDVAYPGADLIVGTEDDGRSLMLAYETIPFRIEGLEEGARLPIIGDNFSFSALPSNPWNLATSLKVDQRFNSDSFLSGSTHESGSNKIALAIAEMGNGSYIEKVALINANMGNTISDLNDNIDHQQSIETLLLDQRRAVSSVSIDEEVADLMRFQRSFQASSRVLSTLDKMLEIVVMGLVR
jgi:flagellar hook-associated protein FlgK